jgi:hypothetical protein
MKSNWQLKLIKQTYSADFYRGMLKTIENFDRKWSTSYQRNTFLVNKLPGKTIIYLDKGKCFLIIVLSQFIKRS